MNRLGGDRAECPVSQPDSQCPTIRSKGNRGHSVGKLAGYDSSLGGIKPQESQTGSLFSGCQQLSIRRKADGPQIEISSQPGGPRLNLLPFVVSRTGAREAGQQQRTAFTTDRQPAGGRCREAFEVDRAVDASCGFEGRGLPQSDTFFISAGGQHAAIRRPGALPHLGSMGFESVQFGQRAGVSDRNSPIIPKDSQTLAIR